MNIYGLLILKQKKIIVSDKIKNNKSLINGSINLEINLSKKRLQYCNYHHNIYIEKNNYLQ